jgi:hypothetical protein
LRDAAHAVLYAYGAALLVGVPAYPLIRCFTILRLWHVLSIAMILGTSVLPMTYLSPGAQTALGGAAISAGMGMVSWWLGKARRKVSP